MAFNLPGMWRMELIKCPAQSISWKRLLGLNCGIFFFFFLLMHGLLFLKDFPVQSVQQKEEEVSCKSVFGRDGQQCLLLKHLSNV